MVDLLTQRHSTTSQWGEDGVIAWLVDHLAEVPRACLEVGAGDGISLSNTFRLWKDLGWRALLIEADDERFESLLTNVAGSPNVTTVRGRIEPTGPRSLAALAAKHGFERFGVMSIDIDANDLEVFESLGALRATIVLVEFNHDLPADLDYRDPPGTVFFRHSFIAVDRVARANGYRTVGCVGPNAILVDESAIPPSSTLGLGSLAAMIDTEFLAQRSFRSGLVRSKGTTDVVAFSRAPSLWMRAQRAIYRTRLRMRRKGAGTPMTDELKQRLLSCGLWL